ncbi:phosphosugar-binding transcriptional regulator [Enterococcus sp. 10A9_DIV0425]|uniref:Phosphosugar-binding transcriptional regulator n=1 Tax=Candidatus Enterococcus wittei TaxID=1987383 RepID=A0A242JXF5_9ENTE|nr:MurR/RpiR family transcriptional regulator [Enterococcus sp. 10A9_DIV0425]OTP09912.1 phosphosugar-binding transcriptional regulator [Enterococcus sp. 10A9_DIV0425]THE11317.1 MurR/RpiR family transcriptional regulator [Enterococcus hirae]
MLLKEKLKQTSFSPSEQQVIHFLQNNERTLGDLTIQQIAESCYVHPSTLIRIAKKMGFAGWVDFRDAFIAEKEYLEGNFQEVDANLPFSENEGIMTIANKIAALEKMTIQDTLSLLFHDELQQAKHLLLRSKKVVLFSSDSNTLIAQSFKLKMNRIKREVSIVPTSGESYYAAYNCRSEDCAILISYTGENQMMLRTAEILKEMNVPILSLTSIGESSLSVVSDVVLRLTTRERLYSKISNFTINTSISYLLDVLYSCVFAENYHENLDYLIKIGQKVDTRPISSAIMKEEILIDFSMKDHT